MRVERVRDDRNCAPRGGTGGTAVFRRLGTMNAGFPRGTKDARFCGGKPAPREYRRRMKTKTVTEPDALVRLLRLERQLAAARRSVDELCEELDYAALV